MRRAVAAAAVLAALLLVPAAEAATVSTRWAASFGPNGTATLVLYTSGTGGVSLRLTGLTKNATYAVALWRGTCATRTRWLTLPSVRTSASGAVVRGLSMTAGQMAAARTYVKTGLVVRVGSKCAAFRVSVVVQPTTAPSSPPSVTPGPTSSALACPSGIACLGSMTTISLATTSGSIGPFAMAWVQNSAGASVAVTMRSDVDVTDADIAAFAPILTSSMSVASAVAMATSTWSNATHTGTFTFQVPFAMVQAPMWLGIHNSGGILWWLLVAP